MAHLQRMKMLNDFVMFLLGLSLTVRMGLEVFRLASYSYQVCDVCVGKRMKLYRPVLNSVLMQVVRSLRVTVLVVHHKFNPQVILVQAGGLRYQMAGWV